MKYFITGGCGFIGTNLIKYLKEIEPECEIVVVDNLLYNTGYYIGDGSYKFVFANITEYPLMLRESKGCDVMIHLAANTGVIPSVENPMYDMDVNIRGTLTCLDVCRMNRIKKFVYASSGAVLGEQTPPLHEDMLPKPLSPYGVSKLAGENYCNAYASTFDVETVSLRFSNVYGPYSYHKNSLIAKFFKSILSDDGLFPIYGDGLQTRDFIYVKDLVRAIVMASKSNLKGEVFQLSSFQEYSVMGVLNLINGMTISDINKSLGFKYEDERRGEVRKSYADNSKIKDMLGFKASFDLITGLKETFKWFKDNDSSKNKR